VQVANSSKSLQSKLANSEQETEAWNNPYLLTRGGGGFFLAVTPTSEIVSTND